MIQQMALLLVCFGAPALKVCIVKCVMFYGTPGVYNPTNGTVPGVSQPNLVTILAMWCMSCIYVLSVLPDHPRVYNPTNGTVPGVSQPNLVTILAMWCMSCI